MILTQATGIFSPITWVLGKIFNAIYVLFFGMGVESLALSIIVFTIITRLILFPFNLKTTRSSKIQQHLRPEFNKIAKKYKGKRDQASVLAQQKETRELQAKYGIKMSQGCITSLIQLPVFIGLYNVIQNAPAYVGKIRNLYEPIATAIFNTNGSSIKIQQFAAEHATRLTTKAVDFASITDAASEAGAKAVNYIIDVLYKCDTTVLGQLGKTFNSNPAVQEAINQNQDKIDRANNLFGIINLSKSPGLKLSWYIIIPILAFLCQLLAMVVTPTNSTGDAQQDAQMRKMKKTMYIMPAVSFLVTVYAPAGLGIYWATSAFISFLITVCTNYYYDHADMDAIVQKAMEKAAKDLEKRKAQGKLTLAERMAAAAEDPDGSISRNKGLNKYGNMSLRNYEYNPDSTDNSDTSDASVASDSKETAKSSDNSTNNSTKKGSLADKAGAVKRFNDSGVND